MNAILSVLLFINISLLYSYYAKVYKFLIQLLDFSLFFFIVTMLPFLLKVYYIVNGK